jgi:uncharacterized DUF497 family protein
MKPLGFTWDPKKAATNEGKHGVSFIEAQSVFYDELALLLPDDDHSKEEERFLLLGMSHRLRVLLVCHCERQNHTVIRVISAREATKNENRQYFARRLS